MRYRAEVDGLRAIAVLPVLLFHAGVGTFRGGFVGVDIFFVISGYLITGIIAEEIRNDSFSIVRFYERRTRRILPALLLVMSICIPCAWFWMSPPEFKDFSQSAVATIFFSSNILFWAETDYFAPAVELKPLLHTWSLAVEEQFYIVFPLLLLLLRRASPLTRIATLAAGLVVSLTLSVVLVNRDPSGAFYLIPTRAWELAIGALIALAPVPAQTLGHRRGTAQAASWLGLGLIVYSVWSFDSKTPYPSYFALAPTLGTALLICFARADDLPGRILAWRPLVLVGLVSYSLYLWHQPVLAFMRLRSPYELGTSQVIAALILTAGLAAATWWFVETPFRDRRRVRTRPLIAATAGVALCILSAGIAGHVTDGFRATTPERLRADALEFKLKMNRGLSNACEGLFTLAPECSTGTPPQIAVWGDSYAMHLVDGLLASRADAAIIQFTKSLCGPILDLSPVTAAYPVEWARGCLSFNGQVIEWLEAHKTVKYALLSSPFDAYLVDGVKLLTPGGEVTPDFQLTLNALLKTLDRLTAAGIRPVVVSPPPGFGGDVGRCLFRMSYLSRDLAACDFPESAYQRHLEPAIRLLREVEKRYPVLWLSDEMCVQGTCRAAWGDVFLYRDRNHLSREGSAAIGQRMRFFDALTH